MLLAIQGVSFRLSRLHAIYYIATFFNNFLPTNIGGDAVRILYTSRKSDARPEPGAAGLTWDTAAAAVVVERLTGVVALLGVCYAGAGYAVLTGDPPAVFRVVAIVGTAATVPALLLALGWIDLRFLLSIPGPSFLKKLLTGILSYKGSSGPMVRVWLLSAGFQVAFVFMIDLLARAAGVEVAMADLLVIVPLQSLVLLLPVTINGIGLSEGGYIMLFSLVGVAAEQALLIAIFVRLLLIPLSVVGGVLYLIHPVAARRVEG